MLQTQHYAVVLSRLEQASMVHASSEALLKLALGQLSKCPQNSSTLLVEPIKTTVRWDSSASALQVQIQLFSASPSRQGAMYAQIRGTADPFWKKLREQLAQNSLEVAAQLPKAFGAGAAAGEPGCAMPSFIVTAMVKGLASGQFSRLLQSRVLEALCCIVRALAAAGDSFDRLPTPSKVCHTCCPCIVLTSAALPVCCLQLESIDLSWTSRLSVCACR